MMEKAVKKGMDTFAAELLKQGEKLDISEIVRNFISMT